MDFQVVYTALSITGWTDVLCLCFMLQTGNLSLAFTPANRKSLHTSKPKQLQGHVLVVSTQCRNK